MQRWQKNQTEESTTASRRWLSSQSPTTATWHAASTSSNTPQLPPPDTLNSSVVLVIQLVLIRVFLVHTNHFCYYSVCVLTLNNRESIYSALFVYILITFILLFANKCSYRTSYLMFSLSFSHATYTGERRKATHIVQVSSTTEPRLLYKQ